jgi:hypothetical protein
MMDAYSQSQRGRNIIQRFVTGSFTFVLNSQNVQRPCSQRPCYSDRPEKMLLDKAVCQKAQHTGRGRGKSKQVPPPQSGKPPVTGTEAKQGGKAFFIKKHDGQNGSKLYGDLKRFRLGAGIFEQVARNDQVPR